MNVFCFDRNPHLAAIWCPDKLTVKMPTEYGQLIANLFSLERLAQNDCPRTKKGTVRTHSHYNHPASVWLRTSDSNLLWLFEHTYELLEEKYARYPKGGRHFIHDFIDWAFSNLKDAIVPTGPQTEFACCINKDQICRTVVSDFDSLDRVHQYRLYLKYDKHYATWIRNRPEWLDVL